MRRYNPPPNPAKQDDSRYHAYSKEYGHECRELDALDPDVLIRLINEHVRRYLDETLWQSQYTLQEAEREVLNQTSQSWASVSKYLQRDQEYHNEG